MYEVWRFFFKFGEGEAKLATRPEFIRSHCKSECQGKRYGRKDKVRILLGRGACDSKSGACFLGLTYSHIGIPCSCAPSRYDVRRL